MGFIVSVVAAALFGPIKDSKVTDKWDASYGCWYHQDEKAKDPPPFFISGTDSDKEDERFALVNVDGKDTVFKLAKRIDPKSKKSKVGDKAVREYTSGKMKLKVVFIVTSVCKPQTGCEGDDRKVVLTLKNGKLSQELTVFGYCAI